MARPKSDDKRRLLLSAATRVFASKGLSASTASITSDAGVAEGTLFIYFKSKDDLINRLYEEVKSDLAVSMLANYPANSSIRERTEHIWNNYVDWGVRNPDQLALMHKIKVWEGLKPQVRDAQQEKYKELETLVRAAINEQIFENIPQAFIFAMLSAQAETTMQFIRQHSADAELYRKQGFEMFWAGLSKKN